MALCDDQLTLSAILICFPLASFQNSEDTLLLHFVKILSHRPWCLRIVPNNASATFDTVSVFFDIAKCTVLESLSTHVVTELSTCLVLEDLL